MEPKVEAGESTTQGFKRLNEVRVLLVSAKLEEDNDIHLVIKRITTSGTMIVEFPLAPTCTANATTGAKARMKNARNAFGAACGVPGVSTFTKVQGRATIRGIGFFDFLHGQTGVAPNGIELHPVLRFMDASCAVGRRATLLGIAPSLREYERARGLREAGPASIAQPALVANRSVLFAGFPLFTAMKAGTNRFPMFVRPSYSPRK
jgi:hypothetical protein